MPLTLKDSRSFETQIIEAVRSVNRALGGKTASSSATYKSDFNQYEVQLIDAIKGIARTLNGDGTSNGGSALGGYSEAYIGTTKTQESPATQALTGISTLSASGLATIGGGVKLPKTKKIWFGEDQFIELVDVNTVQGGTPIWAIHSTAGIFSDSFVSAGGVNANSSSVTGLFLDDLEDVYAPSPSNGNIIIWNSSTNRWENGPVPTMTVDSALSPTSENPVQNKVIYNTIGDIETLLAAL